MCSLEREYTEEILEFKQISFRFIIMYGLKGNLTDLQLIFVKSLKSHFWNISNFSVFSVLAFNERYKLHFSDICNIAVEWLIFYPVFFIF